MARQQYRDFEVRGDGGFVVIDERNKIVHLWNDDTAAQISARELGTRFHRLQTESVANLRARFRPIGEWED